jgi:hypothetical protein
MERINMKKYGFVRWPEEDFSDDGNRFTCYRAGEKVRISKLNSAGQVYISARIDGTKLPYEVYSKLPHYKSLDKLNGVSLAGLTDNDLLELYYNCLDYEMEYTEAENTIVMPSLEEIKRQCRKVQVQRMNEFAHATKLVSESILLLAEKLGQYDWKTLKENLNILRERALNFNIDSYAASLVGNSRSIAFCKGDCYELRPMWTYESILNMVETCKSKVLE